MERFYEKIENLSVQKKYLIIQTNQRIVDLYEICIIQYFDGIQKRFPKWLSCNVILLHVPQGKLSFHDHLPNTLSPTTVK